MLKIFVILALCIVAIKASGHMYVIDSPTSLEFNGNEKLNSDYVGDVVSACLGNWVDDALKWSGLYIINPFSTAKSAVVLIFTGIPEIHLKFQLKSYMLTGSSSQESMNALRSEVESHIVVDFEQLSLATNKIIEEFGEIQAKIDTLKTKFLKPELHSSDKEFLTTMALLSEMTDKIMASPEPPTLVTCHVPLEPIAKTHGEKSPAMDEAMQFVADIMYKLHQSAKKDKLVIAVTEKSEPNRAKRETGDAASAKSLNLAAYYNEDYPVIFNIILWFMVVLGFSLLAICYAIGSMDPGRDSIIYRMTSTRMKKDN